MKNRANMFKLDGIVEVDETYVGGVTRGVRGRGTKKTPVVALVQRDGEIRVQVVSDVSSLTLGKVLDDNIDDSATIMTDEFPTYKVITDNFQAHHTVNHRRKEYARGIAHVNGAESFFGLLKRGLHGSFHNVSKRHLPRYLDEFAFRHNHRFTDDAERTEMALKQTEGVRLPYAQ